MVRRVTKRLEERSRIFLSFFLKFFEIMEKLKSILKSKRFWELLAALVAAFAAYFAVSCTATARIQRSGIHCDTVKVDYEVRSRSNTSPHGSAW